MATMRALSYLIVCIRVSYGWWPFSDGKADELGDNKFTTNIRDESHVIGDGKVVVPFEMKSVEQKFLQESKQLLELSPLEDCQHKVISALRKTCGELNEEELAKMSVQLLNCQSQVENRQIFPCTEDMTVAECTGPMDPHMWNSYHIISNRARSVCYATRQQQFRQQTEAAVNLLSRSTIQQLQAMESLAQSHTEIRQVANESIREIKKEHEGLLHKQLELSSSQESLKNSISENIDQLHTERKLIKERQYQLKNMTDNIRQQLEFAKEMLLLQDKKREESQQRMTTELDKLSNNVRNVWQRIDNSTAQLLVLLNELSEQYESTIDNLKTINNTVTHVLSLLNAMNSAVNIQLGWLMEQLGGAQDGLHTLTAIGGHAMYLLMGCLLLLFIKAPWVSRFALLLLIMSNLVMELKFHFGLSLSQLSVILLTILLGDYSRLWYYSSRKGLPSNPPLHISAPMTGHIYTRTCTNSDISDNELNDLYEDINYHNGYTTEFPPPSTPILPRATAATLSPHKYSPSVTTSTSSQKKCVGMTKSGLPCRMNSSSGSPYCYKHVKH